MNKNNIHPTAIISDKAIIGKGNTIGAYTVIEDNVTIGDNNYIGSHCIIGDIGESIKFFSKQPFNVIIGDNNRLTKQVTIDCGTERNTIVGSNTLMLKNAHVGHDCIIDDNARVGANALVGGHSILRENVIMSIGSVIQPRIEVPKWAYIGACSNVTNKAVLNECWVHYGNPCKPIRLRD
jgi:UDP-N-acetylglucosamine acyltransferase